jgi:hypothetical protein
VGEGGFPGPFLSKTSPTIGSFFSFISLAWNNVVNISNPFTHVHTKRVDMICSSWNSEHFQNGWERNQKV